MQEYRDGTFGEIRERESLLKDLLNDKKELDRTKVIHIGTHEDLTAKRLEATSKFEVLHVDSVEDRIRVLEKEVVELKAKQPIMSDYFDIPSKKEIDFIAEKQRQFLKGKMK